MKLGKQHRFWLVLILTISLLMSSPLMALAAENNVILEIRDILKNEYVDEVSDEVLNAPTVKEMLAKLGDRHTTYMTKTEYNDFLSSLDMSFSGVGIELEIVAEGVQVTKVISGYGADKAGMKAGDIITEAEGTSLAGKSSEFSVSKLRGPAGTSVNVKVKRGTQTLNLDIVRMVIELPLVDSEVLENHIGYVAVHSFGSDTVTQFDKHVLALKDKGVDSWIIDLRNNGGGYTQGALDLLGYITGETSAVLLKNKSLLSMSYNARKQAFTIDQPIVLLTNKYTGSSSEIMTASIKDHHKATIIGETTFGSGRVKSLIPLSNGDYLKMTIYRFFSPYNLPIDEVGIAPHMELTGVDELKTAVLMLKHQNKEAARNDTSDKTGYIQLSVGPNNFALSIEDLGKEENWALGKKILDSAYVTSTLKLGKADGWDYFPEAWLKERYKIYYPGYVEAGNLPAIPLDKVFTITFNNDMDWQSVTSDSIELINAATGQRVKTSFSYTDSTKMTVTPQEMLSPDTEYWLVVHSRIKDAEGQNINSGMAVAKTIK